MNATSVDAFREHARVRGEALDRLLQELRTFPEDGDRAAFSTLFKEAQLILEQDDLELARLFKVSRPTIGRWARGESAPHPIGRKPVFAALAKIARAKLSYYSCSAEHAVA